MNNLSKILAGAAVVGSLAISPNAEALDGGSTIIEPFGLLSENFSGTPRSSTAVSSAPGITAQNSAYGSTTGSHVLSFSFTPGVTPGNHLSNGITQADLGGGTGTGDYNIYATWPFSSTISGEGTTFVLSGPGGTLLTTGPINQNSPSIGTNAWGLLGTVSLVANETYTLTLTPESNTFSSQFVTGVMFEPIPEPSTYAAIFGGLALLGAFVYRRRMNAKK